MVIWFSPLVVTVMLAVPVLTPALGQPALRVARGSAAEHVIAERSDHVHPSTEPGSRDRLSALCRRDALNDWPRNVSPGTGEALPPG